MASNLVPLLFKAGIQRDGTYFQGDYCTDGQWIRFQRGIVKKMGGMKGNNHAYNSPASNILLTSTANNNLYLYVCAANYIYKLSMTSDFTTVADLDALIPQNMVATTMWQSEIFINNNVKQVMFIGANNAADITQNSASLFYYGDIESNAPLTLLNNTTAGINPLINGGICYSNPYLFLYGSNGLVQYSRSSDPLNFTGGDSGTLTISNDKVIFGRPIRGGSNSPAILFWTISSVVRVTNAGTNAVEFKSDVISKSSSILSSKCVVEYDGLFFWPGTDRFFVYNGIVQEITNTINLNYFFNNIDMTKRQKVFGVKNTKYGEIWWFYPEISNIGNPNIGCTRALIYNKRENSWYDTAISRDCGMFFDDLGIMCTYGVPSVNSDNLYYTWRHEYGTVQNWTPNDAGIQQNDLIPSSFTTPTFSWVAFNPTRQPGSKGQLIDRWIELKRIEPDFLMDNDTDEINVVVNTHNYAQSTTVNYTAIPFNQLTEKIDMRVQGRNMSLTFSSTGNFEMGNVLLLVGIGDGQ